MRAVLFDIDGTLLHSAAVDDALYREAVRVVLGDVRLRPSLHEYEFVTDTGVLRQILDDNAIAASAISGSPAASHNSCSAWAVYHWFSPDGKRASAVAHR